MSIEEPKSIWYKKVNVDVKKLLGAVLFGVKGDLPDAATLLAEGLGLETTEVEKIFKLLDKALTEAFKELNASLSQTIDPQLWDLHNLQDKTVYSALAEQQAEIEITPDLFNNPARFKLLEPLQEKYAEYLRQQGVSLEKSQAIAQKLNREFTFAFGKIYDENPNTYYTLLKPYQDNMFHDAIKLSRAWEKYHRKLIENFEKEPVFDGNFSLDKIYVPLRALYEVKKPKEECEDKDKDNIVHVATYIYDDVLAWLNSDKPTDFLRIVSGEPGGGKSTFAKFLAREQANNFFNPESKMYHTLFIPLHRLIGNENPISAIKTHLEKYDLEKTLDKDKRPKNILLILDGLDELTIRGNPKDDVKTFLDTLEKYICDVNETETRMQAIALGRTYLLQSASIKIANVSTQYQLLGYKYDKEGNKEYRDNDNILKDVDQRKDWWERFNIIKGSPESEMPSDLKKAIKENEQLDKISWQPLLCYLLALNYTRKKKKNEVFDVRNIAELYYEIIEEIYERRWGDDSQTEGHKHAQKIVDSFKEYMQLLEVIGLGAWAYGDSRHLKKTDLLFLAEKTERLAFFEKIKKLIENEDKTNNEDRDKTLTTLATSFHFNKNNDLDIEFNHKSFSEYLAVRRLLRLARELYDKHAEDGEYTTALGKWVDAVRQNKLEKNHLDLIKSEIESPKNSENLYTKTILERQQAFFIEIANLIWKKGIDNISSNSKENAKAYANACEALYVLLYALSQKTQQPYVINWQATNEVKHFLYTLHAQGNTLINKCLAPAIVPLAQNGQVLSKEELDQVNGELKNKNHFEAWGFLKSYQRIDLRGADLQGADLQRAYLQGADLQRADLRGADLQRADLRGADLQRADLQRAYLRGADLQRAYLRGADLQRAYLRGADLQRAYLQGADLQGADLQRAYLQGADLQRADLQGAYLQGADLRRAYLQGAYLQGTKILTRDKDLIQSSGALNIDKIDWQEE